MRSEGMTWRMLSEPTERAPWAFDGAAVAVCGSVKEPPPEPAVQFVGRPVADEDAVKLIGIGALADRAAEVGAGVAEAGLADEADSVSGVIGVVAEGVGERDDRPANKGLEGLLALGDL